jgi:hypothetical protein
MGGAVLADPPLPAVTVPASWVEFPAQMETSGPAFTTGFVQGALLQLEMYDILVFAVNGKQVNLERCT